MRPLTIRRQVSLAARRLLGPSFASQYVASVRARGPGRRTTRGAPGRAATSRSIAEGRFDDATTIGRTANPLLARYHYNAVENAILEQMLSGELPARPAVLDAGSGAGHWIEFYRRALGAVELVGVEISASAAAALHAAYDGEGDVTIVEADIADERFDLGRRFDVVNAVDAGRVCSSTWWTTRPGGGPSVTSRRRLAANGRLVVAEHVGLVTHDAGFRGAGDDTPGTLVFKRVRSARAWRTCAREAGLHVHRTVKIRQSRALATPANRLLVLAPPARRPARTTA